MVARATLDLDGVAYRYVDDGDGPPVLMLHGNPSWSYMYRRLVLALRDRHRVLAPDHVGMGGSGRPPRAAYAYDLARRVDDLGRFIDALGLDEPLTLVVHDWGGMIGLAWAVDHPDRVARIVLMNTAAFPLLPGKSLPAPLRLARMPVLGEVLVRGANVFAVGAVHLGVRQGRMPAEVRRRYLAPYGSWRDRLAIHAFVRDIPVRAGDPAHALVAATGAKLVRLAHLPALVVWGMRDPVFDPDYLAEWVRRFPSAEVHRIDAGHFVLEDAPEEVVPAIEAFLSRTAP